MASKYTKVPVNEAGPFTASNNLFSLQMDDLAVSNLSESYLDLEVSFADNANPPNQATGTVVLGDMASGVSYSGAAFIKNFRMEAEKQPFVCEERYRNRLGETMRQFYKGGEEQKANEIYGNGKIKLDTTTNRGHCLIPLSDVAPIGNLMYPNYAMGKTALKLELEDRAPLAYLTAIPPGKIYNAVDINDIPAGAGPRTISDFTVAQPFPDDATAQLFFAGKTIGVDALLNGVALAGPDRERSITAVAFAAGVITLTINAPYTVADAQDMTDILFTIADAGAFDCNNTPDAGASPANIIKLTAIGKTPADFTIGGSYQVGYLEATTAGVVNTDQYKYIAALNTLVSATVNTTTNTNVDLTFQNVLFILPAGKTATNVFVAVVKPNNTALNYTVHKCDLVLAKPIKWSPMKDFTYQTMSLEMVNMPQTTDWRRQYELEPECDALMLITPTTTLVSELDNASSYRNAINSIDTTTEDVRITNSTNGSLYYDMLLKNLDDVKNLQPNNGVKEVVVITERVPPPSGSLNNVIEFRVSSTNNMNAKVVYLYKRLTKAMKL